MPRCTFPELIMIFGLLQIFVSDLFLFLIIMLSSRFKEALDAFVGFLALF
jgi:hypothetical protein